MTLDKATPNPISRRALGLGILGGAGAAAVAYTQPAAAAETLASETWEVVVNGFNDSAVQAAMTSVMSARIGNAVQRKLIFPPGVYHLTQPLLRHDDAYPTSLLEGLTIEGQGKRITHIYWDNAGTAPFLTVSRPRLRFFTLRGFTISSANAGNEFAYLVSDTTGGYNQGWTVEDIEFKGSWLRCFGLDGGSNANLNSEFTLNRVYTADSSVFGDAFFRSGDIHLGNHNQQNQFLNYWIHDCCLTLTKGTVFSFPRGGSIRVQNGSWSAVSGTDEPITWFHMPASNSNNPASNQLTVRDVRFEPKTTKHKVIDCAWSGGSVLFDNCSDGGAVQKVPTVDYNFHRYVGTNLWGYGGIMPSVRYVQCQHAGYHQYDGAAVARGGIVFEGSNWFRGLNGDLANAVAPGTEAVLRWSDGAPRYRFAECYNVANTTNWV